MTPFTVPVHSQRVRQMHRHSFVAGAVLTVAGSVALSACGSSSSTSSPAGSSSGSSSSSLSSSISVGGGSFCTQIGTVISQFSQLGSSLVVSPGQTPSLTSFKQLIAAEASAIDALDSSAPSEIASSFHTLRAAIDQANTAAQGATTLQGLGTAFTTFSDPAVKSANTAISAYLQTSCGITKSSSSSASVSP